MGLSVPEYFNANPLAFEPVWISDILNTLGKTGSGAGAFIAIVLDNTIPGTDEEKAWIIAFAAKDKG